MGRVTKPVSGTTVSKTSFGDPLIDDYLSQTDTNPQAVASAITFSKVKFPYSYIVWVSGGIYYAMGANGSFTSNSAFASLENFLQTSVSAAGGGDIFHKQGSYSVLSTIVQQDYVKILGECGARWELDANVDMITTPIGRINDLMINGLTLDANARSQKLVLWEDVYHGRICNNRLIDAKNHFIHIKSNASNSGYCLVDHNYFLVQSGVIQNASQAGIYLDAPDNMAMNNALDFAGTGRMQSGIFVGAGCQVMGNHISDQITGMTVGGSGSEIIGNYLDSNTGSNMQISGGGSGNLIHGNWFFNATDYSININANCTKNIISGNFFSGPDIAPSYHICTSATVADTIFANNIFQDHTSGVFTWNGAKAGIKILNNVGYNPLGAITNPYPSTTGYISDVAADQAYPATTVVYTIAHSPKFITIYGGTVSEIKIDGVVTGLTSGSFCLNPGQTLKVTHSSAPSSAVFAQ